MREPLPTPAVSRRRCGGVGLVEVLIALAITSFGALSILTLQQWLHVHAEVARQRTEAARLAQEQVEALRAYGAIEPSAGRLSWAELEAGADSPGLDSNTRFERTWQVEPDDVDLTRQLRVRVEWASRADEAPAQRVELVTAIARTDPQDVARLALAPPPGGPFRRAFGRAAAIPLEARLLHGRNRGHSVLAWTGTRGGHLVLSHLDGSVLAHCALPPGDETDLDAACERWSALLLEGYVGGSLPPVPPRPAFEQLRFLRADPTGDCTVEPVFDRNTGRPIADLQRYRCLMQPGDDDADAATPPVWSARLRWAGLPPGVRSCRYETARAPIDARTGTYTRVDTALTGQHYRLVDAGDCPAGSVPHPPP